MIVRTGLFLKPISLGVRVQAERPIVAAAGSEALPAQHRYNIKKRPNIQEKRCSNPEQENCFIYQELFVHWKTNHNP
ncbi:hypothetical protein GX408_20490 [bacterium]|nr:hypothetical protein [bacterium]